MADEERKQEQEADPNGSTDWEAKYNELLGHSRNWEKQAKANKDAAEKLAKLEKAFWSSDKLTGSQTSWGRTSPKPRFGAVTN